MIKQTHIKQKPFKKYIVKDIILSFFWNDRSGIGFTINKCCGPGRRPTPMLKFGHKSSVVRAWCEAQKLYEDGKLRPPKNAKNKKL